MLLTKLTITKLLLGSISNFEVADTFLRDLAVCLTCLLTSIVIGLNHFFKVDDHCLKVH